jgi:regulator of sigma D
MPQERRVESHNLINELVHTRNEMLTIFSELIEHRPFEQMDDDLPGLVEKFCQALIDYTADAHFRLYRFIDERSERRRSIVNVANQVYPKILDSTQIILDFNDKYETTRSKDELDALSQDLSQLGENLAERIELEDRVIDAFKERRAQG